MSGIDRITTEIIQDAEKEAASIIEDAKAAAEKARTDAAEKAREYKASSDDKINQKISSEEKKTQSQCEQVEKLVLLKAKQEIINDVLLKAKAKLLNQDTNDYFDTLLKLVEKQAQADKGVLMLNAKDIARLPENFEKSVNAIAAKIGGMITISNKPINLDGGFILKYGNIEINSSFEALFEENKEELIDIVNGILWT